jgi:putative transposase
MHQSSALIVKYCLENRINNIVIGKNQGWKNGINIGRRNNQNFVSVPHNKLIGMIQYKAEEKGIKVHIVEESYTSKASFLDLNNLPTYEKGKKHKFSGRRDRRGLYKTGKIITNADVNGSYNIVRKFDNTIFNEKNVKNLLTIPTVITPNNNKKKLKDKHEKSQEEQSAQSKNKKMS